MRSRAVRLILFAVMVVAGAASAKETFTAERTGGVMTLKNASAGPVLRYVFGDLPAGEKRPSVETSCFTHPIFTPSGADVSDVGPADHPHHRGTFCCWVKVDGEQSGDWWGWGALAPKDGRKVVNRRLHPASVDGNAGFEAVNVWLANGTAVLNERVRVIAASAPGANVIDYDYEFSAPTDKPVVMAQNPFGGFCYRAKPRGTLEVTSPAGKETRPDAIFNKAENNWPSRHWYDLTYRAADGTVNGVAVMDHPHNPTSTWHIVRGIHMLNPCIVAGGPVTIAPGSPLRLRYRLVAHDGDAAGAGLAGLYESFASAK